MAMALVSRTFVDAPLSPALCKLLLGRPVHFLDLLSSSQPLFRDLLKLMVRETGVQEGRKAGRRRHNRGRMTTPRSCRRLHLPRTCTGDIFGKLLLSRSRRRFRFGLVFLLCVLMAWSFFVRLSRCFPPTR